MDMTILESIFKRFHFMKKYSNDMVICYLKIISIWLMHVIISTLCITIWESTIKHSHFTKYQLKFTKNDFLQIIPIWQNTRKLCCCMNKHYQSNRKHFLQIIHPLPIPIKTLVWCITI
jgi:hypothetical protein